MRYGLVLAVLLTAAFPAAAELVDLELVLAVDVSGSVDGGEAGFQLRWSDRPGVFPLDVGGAFDAEGLRFTTSRSATTVRTKRTPGSGHGEQAGNR